MSDSELRQRQPSPTTSAKTSPKKLKGSSTPPLPNPPPATTVTRGFILTASLALSVTLLLYLHRFHSTSPPSNYLLCSPPGTQKIYSVDHDDSMVECMAVRGDFIVDTGARSMSHEPIGQFRTSAHGSFPQADLTARYSSYKLIHIRPGAIIVPGLTGKSTPFLPPYHITPFLISRPTDSHVHALEYGAQRQIPMEDARNALGEAHAWRHTRSRTLFPDRHNEPLQRPWSTFPTISRETRRSITTLPTLLRVGGGIIPDGLPNSGPLR